MAWIKVTNASTVEQYLINTDKLVTIGRPAGASYTNLLEPGENEEPRRVKETPDELLALIREAEGR